MFFITHRATGAVAALLIAALGALSLARTPAEECGFVPAAAAASTAALERPQGLVPPGVLGST